jgi:2-methylisocitrate lyase-like PEP mutase family enzyme
MSRELAPAPPPPGHPDLLQRSRRLRALHIPGKPLVLPNAWDVATAQAVVAAGFPVVATTSGGIAASLGYEDHEGAPADEMLAAAARIARAVDVPVTVDAEAGYGMDPAELVAALVAAGAAGCNLEDTDHGAGVQRDVAVQSAWLRAVREEAAAAGHELVINARIDTFLPGLVAGAGPGSQMTLVGEALERARADRAAGVDCVFPLGLWETPALTRFVREANGPVNVLAIPPAPALPELAAMGVARVSWGTLLHHGAMDRFAGVLAHIARRP